MTVAAVTQESVLARGETLTTPIHAETKQRTLQLMETNRTKPWAKS